MRSLGPYWLGIHDDRPDSQWLFGVVARIDLSILESERPHQISAGGMPNQMHVTTM
jgi:hypothetical protein